MSGSCAWDCVCACVSSGGTRFVAAAQRSSEAASRNRARRLREPRPRRAPGNAGCGRGLCECIALRAARAPLGARGPVRVRDPDDGVEFESDLVPFFIGFFIFVFTLFFVSPLFLLDLVGASASTGWVGRAWVPAVGLPQRLSWDGGARPARARGARGAGPGPRAPTAVADGDPRARLPRRMRGAERGAAAARGGPPAPPGLRAALCPGVGCVPELGCLYETHRRCSVPPRPPLPLFFSSPSFDLSTSRCSQRSRWRRGRSAFSRSCTAGWRCWRRSGSGRDRPRSRR